MRFKLSIAALTLIGLLFLGSMGLNIRFLLSSQASSEAPSSISSENSYIFASPLQAVANKNDRIRVSVVVLNAVGKGVQRQNVDLSVPAGITVTAIQKESDQYGKAVFDIVGEKQGEFTIYAVVGGKRVGENVTVRFR